MAVLAVAAGNSRIQVARIEAGRVERVERLEKARRAELPDVLARVAGGREIEGSILAGVNPPLEREVAALLEARHPGLVVRIDQAAGAGLVNRCRPPERVGVDRLLAARAALERTDAPTLVVDLGTAVTFNVVTPPGVFQGGLIGPGLSLAARALAAGTAALPEVGARDEIPPLVGLSTDEAIRGGTFWLLVGGLERVARGVADQLGGRPVVLATGGDAERVAAATAAIDQVVPDLVLEGMWYAWRDQRR